jgi:hypothetical protein
MTDMNVFIYMPRGYVTVTDFGCPV